MKHSLLLGCGHRRDRLIALPGTEDEGWGGLTTVDNNPACKPDVLWDLWLGGPLPLPDNNFDEIHAYEVLEHIGEQGNHRTFLCQFEDYWRLLKPGGVFCASVPCWNGVWAWGDPSHRRVIPWESLTFLSQEEYHKQVGVTAMSDFRHIYKADFEPIARVSMGLSMGFVLRAIKPARHQ